MKDLIRFILTFLGLAAFLVALALLWFWPNVSVGMLLFTQ